MLNYKPISSVLIALNWAKIPIPCFVFLFTSSVNSQNQFRIPDSLHFKNLTYFTERLEDEGNSQIADSIYRWSYLNKAKALQHKQHIVAAYKQMLHASPKKLRLLYADSMVAAASRTNDDLLRGSSYLTRGIVYYGQNNYAEALSNYIIATQYISKTKDKYQIYKTKYNLALMKYYLGYYDEALSLLNECVHYYEKEGGKPYLYSLHATSLCYQALKNYEQSIAVNTLGSQKSKTEEESLLFAYFEQSEAINNYFLQNYPESTAQLKHSMPSIIENKDAANTTVSYFYLGKNALAQMKTSEALDYFKKIDTAFRNGTYIRNDVWESFEILSGYYANEGEHIKANYYSNASSSASRTNFKNYKILSGKMAIDYYTRRFRESEEKTDAMRHSRNLLIVSSLALILVIFFITVIFRRELRRKARNDRDKFKKIYFQKAIIKDEDIQRGVSQEALRDVPPEIVKKILDYLDIFERKQHFRDKNIGLGELAKRSCSNTTYVSKVINHRKNDSVTGYLNKLKIEYIHHKLRTDEQYKKYKLQTLAEDSGFKTSQKFSRAFTRYSHGLSPSYFIEQIIKEKNQDII